MVVVVVVVVVVAMVVAFSLHARIVGEGSTNHSPPVLFLSKVEMRSALAHQKNGRFNR